MEPVNRRQVVQGGAAGLAAAALSGCGAATSYLTQPDLPARLAAAFAPAADPVLHFLNRAAYGPRPGDVERVRKMGVNAYLEEQLRPGRLIRAQGVVVPAPVQDTPAAEWRVRFLDTLEMDAADLYDIPKEQVQLELQQAAVLRAVYSRWQLRELMVEFWNDFFNVSQTKSDTPFLKTPYDAAVIRRHALGRFRNLLGATARSPAMLYYLDNAESQRGKTNENYARELMELHTLGVDGGYTQRDVQEVARCFTGWTIKQSFWAGTFQYDPKRHDEDDKKVLGQAIRGRGGAAGQREGEEVLNLLARQPATARYVATRLCRRFVADDPPPRLVTRIAGAFRASDGHVAAALRTLFRSPEFHASARGKLKRPFEFVVSALRALNANTDGAGPLHHLQLMGQLPFHWAMPNGYPDYAEAWSVSLLARWNFAAALVTHGVQGTTVDLPGIAGSLGAKTPAQVVDGFTSLLVGSPLPPAHRERLVQLASAPAGPERLQRTAAAVLAAPEFQWR